MTKVFYTTTQTMMMCFSFVIVKACKIELKLRVIFKLTYSIKTSVIVS